MQLARDKKGNTKGFYTYLKSNRNTRETIAPLQNMEASPVMGDVQEPEVFNALLMSVFTNRGIYQIMNVLGSREREGEQIA